MDATLDPRLAADTRPLITLGGIEVRLADDARWPWLVLVPTRAGVTELHHLSPEERASFLDHVSATSEAVQRATGCRSVNVAMLGNVVAQLHCHVVARSPGDPNWPAPVWGFGTAERYADDILPGFAKSVRASLERPTSGR